MKSLRALQEPAGRFNMEQVMNGHISMYSVSLGLIFDACFIDHIAAPDPYSYGHSAAIPDKGKGHRYFGIQAR